MDLPERQGGAYPSFVPAAGAGASGADRTLIDRRKIVVAFEMGRFAETRVEGRVRLRGPLSPLSETINRVVDIADVPNPNNTQQANRAAVFDEASGLTLPTGIYEMTVDISGPNCLRYRDQRHSPDGGSYSSRRYTRKVWVDYDVVDIPSGRGAATSGSTTAYRVATVVGDPTSLEFAYLMQFASDYPHYMTGLHFNQRTSSFGRGLDQRLSAQFAQYLGTIKKGTGTLGIIRNAYRTARLSRPVSRLMRLGDAPVDSQRMVRNLTTLDYVLTDNAHVAMNRIRYESIFQSRRHELLLMNQGDLPTRGSLRAIRALDFLGKTLDILELGNNALMYGERCRESFRAEQLLGQDLETMAEDQSFSISRQLQIEQMRHIAARRCAEALAMLSTIPINALGWIPGLGWLAAPVGLLSAALSRGENAIQGWVADTLEDNANALLIRPSHYDMMVSGQTYDQLFPSEHMKMLMQLVIRAKLLYDMNDLVNASRTDENLGRIRQLASWITLNDRWHIHRDIVFRCHNTYDDFTKLRTYDSSLDNNGEWIRVHFQEYFPVDCWCNNDRQFKRWFALRNRPEIEIEPNEGRLQTRDMAWTGTYQISIRNFHIFRFSERVRQFIFIIEGDHGPDLHRIRSGESIVPGRTETTRIGHRIREIIGTIIDCNGSLGELAQACNRHDRLSIMPSLRSAEVESVETTFHFGTKDYLMLVCGDTQDRAVLNRMYLLSRPLGRVPQDAVIHATPLIYEIKGSHLIHESRRSRFM
ncbi:MAG: hypothetical protein GY841_21560 [FCB group bacterium]|nr:hypothetical protein [FCB group bacterium]